MFGPVEANVLQQMQRCVEAEPGARAVLCGDNHLGYAMPIGGVIAYREHISPSAVGYDIACGNMAIETDALATDVDVKTVMDDVWRVLSFGMGRRNAEPVDHPVLDAIARSPLPFQQAMAQKAALQLGTVGSGNHYVDLFEDRATGRVWIGVHFGSRGFGHGTTTWALQQLGRKNDAMDAPPVVIPLTSEVGQAYLAGLELAGAYAYAGREWVVDRVRQIIGAHETARVHNHHNYAWWEVHGGERYLVHRKGATPAFPLQRGFVGGTMGDDAVILSGLGGPDSAAALYSTVHGAGRAMSRTKAAGKTKSAWTCADYRQCDGWLPIADGGICPLCRAGSGQRHRSDCTYTGVPIANPKCPKCGHKTVRGRRIVQSGLVNWREAADAVRAKGIELRGAGADEAPACYKNLTEILQYHAGTIEVLHWLKPIGVAMAGPETRDDYRD